MQFRQIKIQAAWQVIELRHKMNGVFEYAISLAEHSGAGLCTAVQIIFFFGVAIESPDANHLAFRNTARKRFAYAASVCHRSINPMRAGRKSLRYSGRLHMPILWLSRMGGHGFHQALRLACLVLLLSSTYVVAQQPLSLDMASVAVLAKDRSWSSKQAHQDAATADAVARRTASLQWGQVNFESQYLRLNDPIQILSPIPSSLVPILGLKNLATRLAPQDNLHVNLEASYPIFTGGKIHNTIKEAREAAKATAKAASDTDDDVVLEAEKDYLSVLLAREVVRLNEVALHSYNEHLDHAQTSYKLGTAANYDVIRAEAAVADQEKHLIEAKNQLVLAEAALQTALALDDSTAAEIGGHLFEIAEQVDLNAAMDAAVHASPLLKALEEKIAAYRSAVRVQQGDYLPQITAIGGKELVTSKLAQTDPTWTVGASARLQLFDGGERRARVSEARSQFKSAEFEYRHAEEQVRLATRSACLDLESARSELASAKKSAERSAESLRLANVRFEIGTGTSVEVLDSNVANTASEIGVQQALYAIDMAYLRVHRYQGDISEIAARIQR